MSSTRALATGSSPSGPEPRGWLAVPPLRLWRLWLALLVAGFGWLLIGSVTDVPMLPHWLASRDKVLHVLAYAALTTFLVQLFVDRRTRVALALALVAVGIGVECLQSLTATRQFELLDMFANVAGVSVAWGVSRCRAGNLLLWIESLAPGNTARASLRG